jgi:hypothetical protein
MVERLRFSRADRLNQLGANAMSNIKYSIDPNLPKETLLSEMQTAAKLAASDNNGERFLGAVITPFSAILVQLAIDAERTARKLNHFNQNVNHSYETYYYFDYPDSCF